MVEYMQSYDDKRYKKMEITSELTKKEIREMEELEQRWARYNEMVKKGAVCPSK